VNPFPIELQQALYWSSEDYELILIYLGLLEQVLGLMQDGGS